MSRTRKGSKGPGWEPWSNRNDKQQPIPYSEDEELINKSEILMGREIEYPLTSELVSNLEQLLVAVNKVRTAYGKPMYVSSGYRPGKYNKVAGGAAKSSHLSCQAVDFLDKDKKLAEFCLKNLPLLEKAGLWMEDPISTNGWVHLQTRPVSVRVFKP